MQLVAVKFREISGAILPPVPSQLWVKGAKIFKGWFIKKQSQQV